MMLLRSVIILFFSVSFFISQGDALKGRDISNENNLLDSLKSRLVNAPDSIKVDLLNKLAYSSYYIQPQNTFQYARQAVELAEKTGNKKGLSEAERMMGIGLLLQNKFLASLEHIYKGLEIAQSIDYSQGIADNYNSIGVMYSTIKDWQQAIGFFRKSVMYQQKAGNKLREAIVISNIGDAYLEIGRLDSSETCINQAYRILKNLNDKTWMSMIFVRHAKVQLIKGAQKQAISSLEQAIHLAKETSQNVHLRNALHELVKLYYEDQKYTNAEKLNVEEIEISRNLGFIPFLTEAYELRYKIQMALNKNEKALKTLLVYSSYKDSLFIQQDKLNLDYLKFKFELEQKEKDFILFKAEKEAQEMVVQAKMQRQKILFIAFSMILLLVFLFSYVLYRSRKTEIDANKQLTVKNRELDQQKKELSTSLKMVKDLNAQLQAYNDSMNHLAIVLVIDTKGHILFVNDNFCKTTGYKKDEVIGKNSVILQSNVHNREFYRKIFNTLKAGKTWRGEICNFNKNRQHYWADTAIAPVMDEMGKPVQFFSLQFEITPRKNYEEQLENQKEELTELNQLKDKMFSIVSHDFRSPLRSLKGALSLYLQGMISHKEMKSLAFVLMEKLNATSNMLDNLLNWARNQLQGIHTNPEIIDLNELVKENIELIQPLAEKKQISLKGEFKKSVRAYADEEMIRLVLRNLISNAVKFSGEGDKVWLEVSENKDHVIISIHDQGIGIDKEQQEHLFKASAKSTLGTANEKGMGLGLILCKEFVKKNGGKLWVESEEGKGSSFYFTLQIGKANKISKITKSNSS